MLCRIIIQQIQNKVTFVELHPKSALWFFVTGIVHRESASDFPPGGAVDTGPAGGQYRLCGGALPQVPLPSGGAAKLPQNGTKPGHQERGMHGCLHLGS